MSEPDAITAHTHVTTHVRDGVALLPHQFHRGGDVDALAASWLAEVQEAEDAAWSILGATLEAATGDALDQLGELLVWPRGSLSDADYRAVLAVVVRCNRSAGTGDEILRATHELLDSWDFTMTEAFPATVIVEPESAPEIPALSILGVLRRMRSGGVGLQVLDVPEGDTFNFSDDPELSGTDAGRGFSTTAGLVGGQLVGMVTT